MGTVRKSAKVAVSLIIFIAILSALSDLATLLSHGTIYPIKQAMNSQYELSEAIKFILRLGYWSIFGAGAAYTVAADRKWLELLEAFSPYILVTFISGIAFLINQIDFYWYIAVNLAALILGTVLSFGKLSSVHGGNDNMISFAIKLFKKPHIKGNPIDFRFLRLVKAWLVAILLLLIVTAIIYFILYRGRLSLA